MGTKTAHAKSRLLNTGENSRKLIQTVVVNDSQMLRTLGQESYQSIIPGFLHTVHGSDSQFHGLPDLPVHLQNIHSGFFQSDFTGSFRKATFEGVQIQKRATHFVVIAYIHIPVRHNAGDVGMPKSIKFIKCVHIFFGDAIIIQYNEIQITDFIIPLL